MTSLASKPCLSALYRTFAFPSGVRGPVERRAFCWLAARFRSEISIEPPLHSVRSATPSLSCVQEIASPLQNYYKLGGVAGKARPTRRRGGFTVLEAARRTGIPLHT